MDRLAAAERRPSSTSFTALLLRRKYLLWRCALACERLRCSLVIVTARECEIGLAVGS